MKYRKLQQAGKQDKYVVEHAKQTAPICIHSSTYQYISTTTAVHSCDIHTGVLSRVYSKQKRGSLLLRSSFSHEPQLYIGLCSSIAASYDSIMHRRWPLVQSI